jgi:excisionase family DNA binding protein
MPTATYEEETKNENHDLHTVSEVARKLRVDDTTVRRWIKQGVLKAIALPHRGLRQAYRVHKSTVDALLNNTANAVTE